MKSVWLIGLMALGLAGCQATPVEELTYSQKKALVNKIIASCIAQGVNPKTRELKVCANLELDREIAIRSRYR